MAVGVRNDRTSSCLTGKHVSPMSVIPLH